MIYLDHNATTMPLPEVKELVQSLMCTPYNPSSVHSRGREAKAIMEQARNRVAALFNIDLRNQIFQVIFTSSGTEANNFVISAFKDADIFISAIEHLSILALKEYFPNIKIIKVDSNGIIDTQDLEQNLSKSDNNKKLVSAIFANNETGVIQPLKEIVEIAKKYNALVHSDIVQAVGKIQVDIPDLNIDFATISGHKFGGILGAAALVVKTEHPLTPLIIGGGQEKGLRSGTENIPAIAGMGLAAEIVRKELKARGEKMQTLQSRLEENLSDAKIVAQGTLRLPNTSLIISESGLEAMTQIIAFDLQGIAVSSGAACSSGKVGGSHVLEAMGLNEKEMKSAIRISFSHTNSYEDVDRFIKVYRHVNGCKKTNIVKI